VCCSVLQCDRLQICRALLRIFGVCFHKFEGSLWIFGFSWRISRGLLRICTRQCNPARHCADGGKKGANSVHEETGALSQLFRFFWRRSGALLRIFGVFCGYVLTSAIQPDTVQMAARREPIVSIKRQGPEGRPIIVNTSHSGNINAAIATTNSNVICVCVCVCVCERENMYIVKTITINTCVCVCV